MQFKKVNPKQSFPELEKEIINYWKENNIFKKSIQNREWCEEFNFYDWPPFATWTPHYWHILAWSMKDVIPRYQTMLWKKVDRKFGWDCHWLPIEWIVEKKLWIKSKKQIDEEIWVFNFNETCRANVFEYVDEWKKTVERMWRWVDMENDYKTMDTNFMESVWWVFKQLYDKWLIYEDYRVVPYSVWMSTPLSNFEVNQWYKDKQDKTMTVKFKVVWSENKYILAWTTTPWTLVANLWLAVWKDLDYSEILDKKSWETYILANSRISSYYKSEDEYSIIRTYKWACLVWYKYEPLFLDFQTKNDLQELPLWQKFDKNTYSVVLWHHVSDDSWTWIVHIAPAYWEDDMTIARENNLWFVAHIDDNWYTSNLLQNNWVFVFDYNEIAINEVKQMWLALKIETINHSYPHCWRTDIPLIYRAISAWYVDVESIKDKMLKANENINWVPSNLKYWRFWKWLEWARDWNISRNRYWWSALPIWQSEDKKHRVCIWSIQELYELNKDFGQIEFKDNKYIYTQTWQEVDLHKHFVDEIKLKDPKTWVELKRIPEVLDCWFESWAMPYASKHYPFENSENFKFPADFIAEGIDQTRWWFYTLVVLSRALFDKNPFENVIVNWIVLAEDGKKMSKRLQNYTDPNILMDKFWADAMRFYLMNSPVVQAEDLRFSDSWVEEVVKKVILPLWNTYYFFTTYANIDNFSFEEWNLFFVRHAESETNSKWEKHWWSISWAGDNPNLTEKWINQAKKAWEKLRLSNTKIDIIISSPLIRALDTAKYIASEIWYNGEIILEEWLKEQDYSDFEWRSHQDIATEYNIDVNDKKELRRIFKSSKVENYFQFQTRVENTLNDILEKYKWKNILLVWHAWSARPVFKKYLNLDIDYAHLEMPTIENAKVISLPKYPLENPLDKWIYSEFNKLVWEITNSLNNYKLNEASKPITIFLDNLTNWYIRRSRKRFWDNWLTQDKLQAYNTLWFILKEVSKVIAPYMPFLSENIYTSLTWDLSVHLQTYPEKSDLFILNDLNKDFKITQDIVSLWLKARVNIKQRVRQPLSYIKIPYNLDSYYIDIIKDELNIKEVIIFKNEELPQKIAKPNARLLWPKFWSSVKDILQQAKSWNFIELPNWNIKVLDFEIEKTEFDFEFLQKDITQNEHFESEWNIVIAINKEVTKELKIEWFVRDIVRHIQESRKEANYDVQDRIKIYLDIPSEYKEIIDIYSNYICEETLSSIEKLDFYDLEKEIDLEEFKIKIQLKK